MQKEAKQVKEMILAVEGCNSAHFRKKKNNIERYVLIMNTLYRHFIHLQFQDCSDSIVASWLAWIAFW